MGGKRLSIHVLLGKTESYIAYLPPPSLSVFFPSLSPYISFYPHPSPPPPPPPSVICLYGFHVCLFMHVCTWTVLIYHCLNHLCHVVFSMPVSFFFTKKLNAIFCLSFQMKIPPPRTDRTRKKSLHLYKNQRKLTFFQRNIHKTRKGNSGSHKV